MAIGKINSFYFDFAGTGGFKESTRGRLSLFSELRSNNHVLFFCLPAFGSAFN